MSQIQLQARRSQSVEDLRAYFDRVHELRRAHADDFDMQVLSAEVQEEIIEHARALRSTTSSFETADTRPVPPAAPAETPQPAIKKYSEAAEIPPEVPRLDKKSWQRSLLLSFFITAVILSAIFYLIQTARRINLPETQTTNTAQTPAKPGSEAPQTAVTQPVTTTPVVPTLRLYTDLVPGTVSIDGAAPQPLRDGELNLDHLQDGQHNIQVSGNSGSAAFTFKVDGKTAPEVVGIPTASNALTVLVSAQDGKARIVTNAQNSSLLLDGKPVGEVTPDGLSVDGLGTADHELQLNREKDKQRFVWTYTPAPVLTVYVKSDPNAGTAVVMTKLDGVNVWVNDKPARRQTEHGQLRIPLKVGEYTIRVHKDGYVDPPPQSVDVKKSEDAAVEFSLQPLPVLSSLEVKDAQPGTSIMIDNQPAGAVGPAGTATIHDVKPGEHSITLQNDQFAPRVLGRMFQPGKAVILSGDEVKMDAQTAVAANPNASTPEPRLPAANTPPAGAASTPIDIPGEQVRKGGGFVAYHVPRAPGHYSFSAHSRIGGFLKHSKLQWYAGYQDSQNYVLFTVDGKHAIVRDIRDGKPIEVNRIPFTADSNEWVEVDLSVKPDSIDARLKTPDAPWHDIGTVASQGRDFTQGTVGFYVPGNDEIAVANFHFSR